ncbi:tripartite motif-containing protein 2 isoform X2 [Anoplophora glabripennis]|uniref:tripartite motif-containing protein 2 isoform X2 n=1 Tax=Anoplophora glabripennis TaxID=217634 RepID=UPI0008746B14|nr:tripartite motif-containing protein 2 isoform X2 [Anoplophora glabripennis]
MFCCSRLTRLGERMVSMNSTLVETVSINYEDFNESFLTCGTCLYGIWSGMYDGQEHTPKLLQCSHTVCLHCLTRIAASQTRDTGSFRCPICRELITIPRGGVSALPPSFLVNQLLDLMSRQRREVIPKCSVHINQELLFCETCDTVFCTLCTGGSHNDTANSCEHTIIPFSIAIKRMSEILLYKANECISKLTQAQEGVSAELTKLDLAKETCLEQINTTFQQIQTLMDQRKQEIIDNVNSVCSEKRRVLEEQHSLIESEKNKVEQECQGLQYQVEVRNITQRIEILSEKLDATTSLGEPRENAFLTCDFKLNDSLEQIQQHLSVLGKVRTSTTFPSLCSAHLEGEVIAGIENYVTLKTVDYHGNARKNGGDPVEAELLEVTADESDRSCPQRVVDCDDGTYKIYFRATNAGRYGIKISVIDRPIKDNPLYFDVTEHNNPVCVYGSRGSGKDEFMQPVAVAIDERDQTVYVLDTGNSRVKVLNEELEFVKHVTNEGLLGRSCTGIAISNEGLVVVNWRSKYITEMTTDGETIKYFTYNAFQEPIDVAVDKSYGHVLVADNGMSCVFVFDAEGKILFQVGKKGTFSLISSVTVGPLGEIIVADSRIQAFSAKGDFMEVVYDEGRGKGRYGGITIDPDSKILVSRTEQKGRTYVQLLSLTDSSLNQCIDSHDAKLKRPSGLATTNDHHVIVVDLGNNCIKKYRYW